jgi:hypothetical protein
MRNIHLLATCLIAFTFMKSAVGNSSFVNICVKEYLARYPNGTGPGLVDARGAHVNNISEAMGITISTCNEVCGRGYLVCFLLTSTR